MAQPHLLGQERIQPGSFHDPVRRAPNAQRVGRWHKELSPRDQRFFQRLAGPMLAAYGYPLANLGEMPVVEKIRWAALAAKYFALHSGRDLLQIFGIYAPN